MVIMPRTATAPSSAKTSRNRAGRAASTVAKSPPRRSVAARDGSARANGAGARKPGTMSDEHKAALAAGRAEGRTVRTYLEALERHRPRRGRRRTPDTISRRLSGIEAQLGAADALTRLHLLKEKGDLEAELDRARTGDDLATLEREFVKVARSYGERKGISYSVWRAAGVNSAVLQRAGVIRGGSRSR